MQQQKWFDRQFVFGKSSTEFPAILLRLKKTTGQLMDLTALPSEEKLTHKPGGKWSAKEHIGHLYLLEILWRQRFQDIVQLMEVLSVADLQNKATDEANFNSVSLSELIGLFSKERQQTLDLMETFDVTLLQQTSLHPRLRVPMNMVDHAYFVAEHDTHHLDAIKVLLSV